MPANLEKAAMAIGLEKVSFHSRSKEGQCQRMFKLLYNCGHFKLLTYVESWHATPVLLPGKSHGWRSLVGCCPWGCEELDTTEQLHVHFSLSCIGDGNGNPLQSSCLENPRDREAWWAAIYGVAQSQTQLK